MLAHLSSLITDKSTEEVFDYWSTTIEPSIPSVTLYTSQNMLMDTKLVNYCSSINQLNKAKSSMERLTIHKDINHNNCNLTVGKMLPYITKLPIKITWKIEPLDIPYFKATNPSIILNPENENELLINVRHVNYYCTEQNQYICNKSGETIVHTKNAIYVVNKDLPSFPKKTFLLEDHTDFVKYPSPVQDLEDIRLVARGNEIWASCTSRECLADTTPQIMLTQVIWPKKEIIGGLRLLSPDPAAQNVVQKNWLPFIDHRDNELKFIYSFGPNMLIIQPDEFTGLCKVVHSYPTGLSFQQSRGGSPPIVFKLKSDPTIEFMCIVHFAYDQPNIRRKYFHRFIFMDKNYKPVSISEGWFLFEPHSIEFVISAVALNESIYIGTGRNDVDSYVLEIDNSEIEKLKRWSI